jgi:hypothetical protein
MCRRAAVVIDTETTDLHSSTCKLHAVLVMTSSIRQIGAVAAEVIVSWRLHLALPVRPPTLAPS